MIAVLIKALLAVLTKLLLAMGSEAMIKWALFKVAEVVVKSTETKHDDEWLVKIKEAYEAKEKEAK